LKKIKLYFKDKNCQGNKEIATEHQDVRPHTDLRADDESSKDICFHQNQKEPEQIKVRSQDVAHKKQYISPRPITFEGSPQGQDERNTYSKNKLNSSQKDNTQGN